MGFFCLYTSYLARFHYFEGAILDNSTYSQIAILYPVSSRLGNWWDKIEAGYCKADAKGGNAWITGPLTNHSYLRVDYEVMATLIEDIMLNRF